MASRSAAFCKNSRTQECIQKIHNGLHQQNEQLTEQKKKNTKQTTLTTTLQQQQELCHSNRRMIQYLNTFSQKRISLLTHNAVPLQPISWYNRQFELNQDVSYYTASQYFNINLTCLVRGS
jgi:histidyl-tRNA synthetase